jgi:hypothetical protein
MGSPLPEAADRRCEGVADLAARRARVSQALFFTDGATADLIDRRDDDPGPRGLPGPSEMIYDGANAYLHVAGRWTGFFLVDPGVPATRYRLTVDLARADAALPAGVSAPGGPYRSLRALPAEVWLDAAGLARRISVLSEPTAAADAQVWSIIELWDFGVAADITPPGTDEVLAPAEAYQLAEEDPFGRDA